MLTSRNFLAAVAAALLMTVYGCECGGTPTTSVDGGGGGGGGGGTDAGRTCAPACSGATPVCDEATLSCVTCTATTGCSGATPVCNTSVAGGACVACLANADCSGATPACDTETNTCVGCTANAGCSGATPVCDTAARTCVGCTANTDCSGNMVCDTTARVCVGCTANTDCPGATPVCDTATQVCVICLGNADCSGATPVCDTSVQGGACVGCLASTDCSGATPVCDTATRTCATCLSNADCSGATPVCDTSVAGGACVACTANADCSGATPACDTASNTCVACTANSDCSGATPACNTTTFTCVACTADTDCSGATPVCNPGSNTCVGCTANANCSGATPVCDPATMTCAVCVANTDCSGTTPVCDTSVLGGACVGCTSNTHCTSPLVCDAGTRTCVPAPDTCATAQTLTFTNNQAPFSVDTTTLGDDHDLACNPTTTAPNREAVFTFTLAQAQDVTVTATGADTGTDVVEPVLALRSAPCATGTLHACVDPPWDTNTIVARNLQPGTYFLFVESDGTGDPGPISGTVTLEPPSVPPTNETCATAQVLTLTPGTPTTVSTQTSTATNDVAGTCNPSSATAGWDTEVVYELTLTQAQDIVVTATSTGASAADPVLYLRGSPCDTGTQLACVNASAGGTETTSLYNQPAGTYYLFVETANARSGWMDVTVLLNPPTLPPANDSCAAPESLTFAGNQATFSTTTVVAADEYNGACNPGSPDPEVVYSFTLAQAQDVVIQASAVAPGEPVLYLRQTTCDTGVEVGCVDAFDTSSNSLTSYNLQPGTYFLFVETDSFSPPGPISGTVTLLPPTLPPANDACAAAEPLTFTGNQATFSTTTVVAADEYEGTCNVTTSAAPEVVYSFTLAQAQDVLVEASTVIDGQPVLYLRQATCDTGAEVGCEDPLADNTSSLRSYNLQPGTYFLFVETDSFSEPGAISGTVTLLPPTPPPANDVCTAAQLLPSAPATVTGSTLNGTDDYDNSCGSTTGNDVVYQFALAAPAQVAFKVTPDPTTPGFKPTLYVRNDLSCASTTSLGSLGCIQGSAQATDVELVIDNLAAGTYYLIVDGASSSQGKFTLQVATNSIPAGGGESCSAPAALAVSGGTAVVYGTTTGATADTSSSCDADTAGAPDHVYSFTTPVLGPNETGLNVKAILNSLNANQLSPVLSMKQNCAGTTTADNLICTSATTSPHQVDDVELGVSPATTYYLVVDGAAATTSAGPYRLELNLVAAPSANDVCAGALPLTANTSVAGSNLGAANDYDDLSPNAWYTGGACTGTTFQGPDVVYTYTATATGPVTVTVFPQRGFDVGVGVLSSCAQNACIASDEDLTGDVRSVSWMATAGAVYYLVVDSNGFAADVSRGGFIISVAQ